MKIVIQDKPYDVTAINQASLSDLMALKKQTGLTPKALKSAVESLQTFYSDKDADPADIFEHDDAVLAIAAMIWLARWKSGERLTLEQACDFPLEGLAFVADEDDEPEETPDPS